MSYLRTCFRPRSSLMAVYPGKRQGQPSCGGFKPVAAFSPSASTTSLFFPICERANLAPNGPRRPQLPPIHRHRWPRRPHARARRVRRQRGGAAARNQQHQQQHQQQQHQRRRRRRRRGTGRGKARSGGWATQRCRPRSGVCVPRALRDGVGPLPPRAAGVSLRRVRRGCGVPGGRGSKRKLPGDFRRGRGGVGEINSSLPAMFVGAGVR